VLTSADRHVYEYRDLLGFNVAAAPELPALPRDPRVDTTWNYAGSVGYRVGKGRVGFGASYWQRDSNARTFRDYDNLRFGTTVTYGF
jgi:hypothetical protein